MCADHPPLDRRRLQRGLTLIELIVFIIIVSVGIAGILTVMNVTVKASSDPLLNKQAIAFADAILEEVLTKEYTPNAGYDTVSVAANCAAPERMLSDDVDDYNCFDGTTAAKTIDGSEALGATALALAGYQAKVAVAPPCLGEATMKSVTVTVTDPAGATYSLTGCKADY